MPSALLSGVWVCLRAPGWSAGFVRRLLAGVRGFAPPHFPTHHPVCYVLPLLSPLAFSSRSFVTLLYMAGKKEGPSGGSSSAMGIMEDVMSMAVLSSFNWVTF